MGRAEEFENRIAELKGHIEREQHPKLMRAYYYLLGHRELREGHPAKAIDFFWQAASLLPPEAAKKQSDADSAQYWASLGEAYDAARNCDSAKDAYKRVRPYWDQRYGAGDVYARSFYRLAMVHQACSKSPGLPGAILNTQRTLAAENYRKFLSLWKDADPVFRPEVEDAARRLAALEADMASGGAGPVK